MTQTVSAEFDGKVIVPDHPLGFPRGQRLRITIEPVSGLDQSKLVAQLPPELECREDGVIVVRGHRITLHLILDAMDHGNGLEEIHERFPDIGKNVVGRILEFCRQHTDLVRQYCEEQKSLAQQYRDSAHQGPSRDELREAALARLLRHAGAVDLGRPTGTDNLRIDQDLATEYASTHAGEQ